MIPNIISDVSVRRKDVFVSFSAKIFVKFTAEGVIAADLGAAGCAYAV